MVTDLINQGCLPRKTFTIEKPNIDEKYYKNSDFSENNGLLVMFICNHCPFVQHINERLVDFTNDLIAKNILELAKLIIEEQITQPA